MIVCKFGGSSVAREEGARKIKEIVCGNKNRKIIVVSALGKCAEYDYKITEKLFELNYLIKNNLEHTELVNEIFNRHQELCSKLNVKINWEKEKNILNTIIKNSQYSDEFIISRGEYYSALIYSKYLNYQFIDAKNYIIFNKNGKIDEKLTKNSLKKLIFTNGVVIGGFYGANKHNDICLFDRGGSDITGAVICSLLNCEIYENFTDVSGIYNKNPNVFDEAQKLPALSFETAIKMAEYGNEVIHKDALKIMRNSQSLLLIKNTYKPDSFGTIITNSTLLNKPLNVCFQNAWLLISEELDTQKIKKLKRICNIRVLHNGKYVCIIKDLKCSKESLLKTINSAELHEVKIATIFSESKINCEIIKKLQKILQKLKKILIFGKFTSYFNALILIFEKDNQFIVNKTLKQKLHTININ